MFAKSVEDEKALHTANKTVMIPLLNIKHTVMCKKRNCIYASCCKDKGLGPKKGRTISGLHHRTVPLGSGFCLCLLPVIWAAAGKLMEPAFSEAAGEVAHLRENGRLIHS